MVASPRCANPDCARPLGDPTAGPYCPACATRTILSSATPSLRDFPGESGPAVDPSESDTLVDPPALLETTPQPECVGRFVLQRFLGEGVFGRVYLAHDPRLDRAVALKVAKAEHLASPERRERFFREARAAANLRHPHIVPLFEMGQAGDQAFIASAYIEGRTLEAALKAAPGGRFAAEAAARVVLHLAEALAYAHEQGVVHRDVKPANVLLDDKAGPLLMDFGLAARVGSESRLTYDGTLLGTPLYMAPETCGGSTGDPLPASDQYGLGVVLYELLTGRPPFVGTLQAVLYQHQTQEPPPPRQIRPDLPRDLETVVLKCLHKAPAKRYATCQDLADDLRRWLDGEPIRARPLGTVERLLRGAYTHPALALVSGALVVSLVVGLILVGNLYLQADRDRARAEAAQSRAEAESKRALTEAGKARAATRFLMGTFEASDPLGLSALPGRIPRESGEKLTAVTILDRGAARLEADATLPDAVRAAVHDTIGSAYRSLGRYPEAEKHLRAARDLRGSDAEADPLDRAATLHNLAWLLHEQGNYPEAEKLYRDALALRRASDPDPALTLDTQFNLALLLGEMSLEGEATRLLGEVLDARQKLPGDQSRAVAVARLGLAALHLEAGRYADAAAQLTPALEYFQSREGGQSIGKAVGRFQQAMLARALFNNFSVAEANLKECLALTAEALGPHSIYVQLTRCELADLYAENDKPAEAEALYREALAFARRQVGMAHPKLHLLLRRLGDLLVGQGKVAEVAELFDEAQRETRARFGSGHYLTGRLAFLYARVLEETADKDQRAERIEGLYVEAVAGMRTAPRELLAEAAGACNRLGIARDRRNASADAVTAYRDGLAILADLAEAERQRDPDLFAFLSLNLASTRMDQKVYDAEVETLLRRGLESARSIARAGEAHRWGLENRSRYLRHHKRFDELRECFKEYRSAAGKHADGLYDLAVEAVRAGNVAADDVREGFYATATDALQAAVGQGLKNPQRLKTAPIFATLRDRPEFKKLVGS